MPDTISAALAERFRAAIEQRTGLALVTGKSQEVFEQLPRRAAARKLHLEAYVASLARGELRDEVAALAPLLTVAETYFNRNVQQLDACRELARQYARRPAASARPFHVLSAGCASGEEAYSLAILLREAFAGTDCKASIVGCDLNPRMLARAKQARYSEWSLRTLDADSRLRWFQHRGNEWLLHDTIRTAVEFVECNLAQPDAPLFCEPRYDVIFCRNVLMYFSQEQAQQVVARLTRSLLSHGHLFMGHAETLRGLSHDFHLCHTHDAFYYRRKTSGEADSTEWPALQTQAAIAVEEAVPPAPALDSEWFSRIDQASARVQLLDAKSQALTPLAAQHRGRDLSPVVELMRRDRHGEALELFGSTTGCANPDPDQLLVEAALLTHANQFTAAESVCRRLLQIDELNAGAHYVLALCCEAGGDLERALHHDQVAAYLDPGFAMPHVHMGLLLRRSGRRDAAQRELAEAHSLLEREDTARVSMFGGGFDRAALLAMCAPGRTSAGAPT